MPLTPVGRSSSWGTTTFALSYWTLLWSLMSRGDSVSKIQLEHFRWQEGCLLVQEQGHKGDQTGALRTWKHVYSNVYQPHVCPILALAVHIFSYPVRTRGATQQLFVGTDPTAHFRATLKRTTSDFDEHERDIIACLAADLGIHSARKGSGTYALGQVQGPTAVSVTLRMRQSLGRDRDCYIHHSDGVDQLCGHTVVGLPYEDKHFTALPPHSSRDVLNKLDVNFWSDVLPSHSVYPFGFRAALQFLPASLFHHESFFGARLNTDHPLFHSRVFAQNPLLDILRSASTWQGPTTIDEDMKPTEVPPHLLLAHRIATMEKYMPEQVAALGEAVVQDFTPRSESMPLTLNDLDAHMENLRCGIVDELGAGKRGAESTNLEPDRTNDVESWKTWDWHDGTLGHRVSKGWRFPVCNTKKLWDFWYFGDTAERIRPYRHLSVDIDIAKTQNFDASRAKAVIDAVTDEALKLELVSTKRAIRSLTLNHSDTVFFEAYDRLTARLKEGARRYELSYTTIYNRLRERR